MEKNQGLVSRSSTICVLSKLQFVTAHLVTVQRQNQQHLLPPPLLLHRLRYGLMVGWPTQASHGSGAAGASECVFDASAGKDGLMGYRPHRTCCLQECSRRLFSQRLEGAADCSCNFGALGSKQPLNSPSPLPTHALRPNYQHYHYPLE